MITFVTFFLNKPFFLRFGSFIAWIENNRIQRYMHAVCTRTFIMAEMPQTFV